MGEGDSTTQKKQEMLHYVMQWHGKYDIDITVTTHPHFTQDYAALDGEYVV